jgi:hypothetical protein
MNMKNIKMILLKFLIFIIIHKELKNNIEKVIKDIPKEKYENIIKGTYNRTKKYSKKPSNRRKTLKNYL